MKAKEQFNIGKALMKHELEKKSLAKEMEDPLSQKSAGSASSYYSGKQPGKDKGKGEGKCKYVRRSS